MLIGFTSVAPQNRYPTLLSLLKSSTIKNSENITCDSRDFGFLPRITYKTMKFDKFLHSVCDKPGKEHNHLTFLSSLKSKVISGENVRVDLEQLGKTINVIKCQMFGTN